MDGINFHAIFSIQKNPYNGRYCARFDPNTKTTMGETAEMLYFRSRDTVQHFLNTKVIPSCEKEFLKEISGKLFDI